MDKTNLRILQLGKFYPIRGGVEKVAYDLTVGLSERGIDCDMMCAALEGGNRVIPVNGHSNIICCHSLTKAAATMISPAMISALRSRCKNYDIIHIHHPDPMACMALFLSGYKGKVVLHWHSDIQKQKILLKFYKPLQTWLLKRADIIVGTSPVYLAESPCLKHVYTRKFCLPIGVEPMQPSPASVSDIRRQYGNRKIVFSLGRLVAYKGFNVLVASGLFLDDSYVILIGGTGAMKEKLQEQINELGLQNRVKLLGRISDEDLPSYYGACDVFCLSSVQKTEAFGIVIIEAMSCGKPIIATNIPESGVPWVNEHGTSGENVAPEDALGLANAIKKITSDSGIYSKYAQGSLMRYQNTFTKERMIKKCLDLYYHELWKK